MLTVKYCIKELYFNDLILCYILYMINSIYKNNKMLN
jgi:hypothetical protein